MKKRSNRHRKKKNERLLALLKFLIKFNIFAVPLYLLILTGFSWQPLMNITANISFAMLRFIGVDASMSDSMIVVPVDNGNFGATVSWDSTGWKSMLALFALVFATEYASRKKLIGLLLIPLVYFVNILRIVFIFFVVSKYDVAYYGLLHTTLWSWGLIITIILLWAAWMKYVK